MSILKDLDPENARFNPSPSQQREYGMGLTAPTVILSLSTLALLAALLYGEQALQVPDAAIEMQAAGGPLTAGPETIEAKTATSARTEDDEPPLSDPAATLKAAVEEDSDKPQANPLLMLEDPSAGPVKLASAKQNVKPVRNKTASSKKKTRKTRKTLAKAKQGKRTQQAKKDEPLQRDVDIITAIVR